MFAFAARLLPVLLVFGALTACDAGTATVTRVVDGDTIDVVRDGHEVRVRLLNIDAPESVDPNRPVDCLGPEAAAFLTSLLPAGTAVRLEFDDEHVDRYGRVLAGVYSGDRLVNAEIARAGLGVAEIVGENRRFYDEVQAASQDAERQHKGLFDPAAECTVAARVSDFETRVAAVAAAPLAMEATAVVDLVAEAAQLVASIDPGEISVRAWGAAATTLLTDRIETAAERARTAAAKSAEARRAAEEAEAARKAQEQAAREAERKAAAEAKAARDAARRQADADTGQPQGKSSPGGSRRDESSGSSSGGGSSVGKYTGCRAYGPKGTSIDEKGRPYTKIDCTTKQPI